MKTFRKVYALMEELNQKIETCRKIASPDTVAVTFTTVPETAQTPRLEDIRQTLDELATLAKSLDTELDAAIEEVQETIDDLKQERAELREQVREQE